MLNNVMGLTPLRKFLKLLRYFRHQQHVWGSSEGCATGCGGSSWDQRSRKRAHFRSILLW